MGAGHWGIVKSGLVWSGCTCLVPVEPVNLAGALGLGLRGLVQEVEPCFASLVWSGLI